MRSSSTEWDQLGEREPYFAVLTDERFLRDRIDIAEFYATGEADVARLFADIGEWFHPKRALDFGCGVGRLTAALTRRVPVVVGCDAAESMLRLARAAVPNATFVRELPDQRFDLVCSLIVFQHIPVAAGMAIVDRLLGMVDAGGVAALHFTFRRPGGALRRLARRVRARLPLLHRLASRVEGDRRGLPYMQMNEYDLADIRARLRSAGFREPVLVPTNHGGIEGAIVIAQKRAAAG
jgi:trans-aconitate methyltransferase